MKFKQLCWGLAIVAGAVSCKNEKAVSPGEVENTLSKATAQTLAIIRSVTENTSEATQISLGNGGASCQSLTSVTSSSGPIRGGSRSFRHSVSRCGERSELEIRPFASKGGTYAYGWSVYVPTSWSNSTYGDDYSIITQFALSQTPRDFSVANGGCGGVGSKISIKGGSNQVVFDFAHKGSSRDIQCDQHEIFASVNEMKGKWVDFVMRVKWTGDSNGFLKLYRKVQASGEVWKTEVDYTGATFWNDEKYGPYFKMGIYKGFENWPADNNNAKVLFTDEYRQGDANASFQDVSPGDSGSKTW